METEAKILSLDRLVQLRQTLKTREKMVVFTNGCFDLLHVGHVRALQEARSLGDALIVGLNSDASVRRLKGDCRPLVPQRERAEIVAALACVDFVTIFEESTPEYLIQRLTPDIHCKGGDYTVQSLPEAETVRSGGGKVHILSYTEGHSTTNMIEHIVRCFGDGEDG